MLSQMNRNVTRMVRTRFSWRPSETALRTVGMMFVGGAILALCTFPAWASAAPSGAEQGEGGFRTAGFMFFIAGMSLAPFLILISASLARLAMLRSGWEQQWEFDYPLESDSIRPMHASFPRLQAPLPNNQFGIGRVQLPRHNSATLPLELS